MNVIYSGYFVDDVDSLKKLFPPKHANHFYHHQTITFRPKDISDLEVGKKLKLEVIGRYTDEKVDCLIVKGGKSSNRFPHITLSTAEGVKPFECNTQMELNWYRITYFISKPRKIPVTCGYFNGQETIKEL